LKTLILLLTLPLIILSAIANEPIIKKDDDSLYSDDEINYSKPKCHVWDKECLKKNNSRAEKLKKLRESAKKSMDKKSKITEEKP
jgi:hypothetical protein